METCLAFTPSYDPQKKCIHIDLFGENQGIKVERAKKLIRLIKDFFSFFGIGAGNFLVYDLNNQPWRLKKDKLKEWIRDHDESNGDIEPLKGRQKMIDRLNFIYTKKRAEKKDPEALHALGLLYEKGIGTYQSDQLALLKYQQANLAGSYPFSKLKLVAYFEKGKGLIKTIEEKNNLLETAFSDLKELSKTNLSAKVALGQMYVQGKGTKRSDSEAFKLFSQAAEQGSKDAIFEMGRCYQEGLGVKISTKKAIEWYLKNARRGDAVSQCALGRVYAIQQNRCKKSKVLENYYRALNWLQKARANGCTSASIELGFLSLSRGNIKTPMKHFADAFAKGHAEGAFYKAKLLESTSSYKFDMSYSKYADEIEHWYTLAKDYPPALVKLAHKKQHNAHQEAIQLLESAAQKSYVPALFELGCLYFDNSVEKSISYLEQAAEKGSTEAMEFLVDIYEFGEPRVADLEKMAYWKLKKKYVGGVSISEGVYNVKQKVLSSFGFLQNPEEISFEEISELIDYKVKSINSKPGFKDLRENWDKDILLNAEKTFIKELKALFDSDLENRMELCKFADQKAKSLNL